MSKRILTSAALLVGISLATVSTATPALADEAPTPPSKTAGFFEKLRMYMSDTDDLIAKAMEFAQPYLGGSAGDSDPPGGPASNGGQNGAWEGGNSDNPNRQIGKLFYDVDPGPGVDRRHCTATVVNSENRSLIVTAGHCVYKSDPDNNGVIDGNGWWYEDFEFCPGYENGCQLGTWKYRDVSTTPTWYHGFGSNHAYDYRDDVAVLVLAPNEQGYIQDVVGAHGITFNQDAGLDRIAMGYPAQDSRWSQYSYTGEDLIYCHEVDGYDNNIPGTMSIPCTMTGGASGGPWLTYSNSDGMAYVNGVNSHKPYGGEHMSGAYFDDAEEELFNKWRNA